MQNNEMKGRTTVEDRWGDFQNIYKGKSSYLYPKILADPMSKFPSQTP